MHGDVRVEEKVTMNILDFFNFKKHFSLLYNTIYGKCAIMLIT